MERRALSAACGKPGYMNSKRVSLPPAIQRDSSSRGRGADVPRSSVTLEELSFRQNRAETTPVKSRARSSSEDCFAEQIDSSKFRRLKLVVDTGRTSSSSRPDDVLSPTALHDVLAVDRRNSRTVKDRLPAIVESPEENDLEDQQLQ
mmetsp:Transcript_9449/g.19929  ORF Transcript_9449/g.19929 Transcript_9449/m.19929 type:complete len:147 (-) Transcript_9449:632-1072(-)